MKEGDRFGQMTYTGEEKVVKGNRYIKLECSCGHTKWFYISEILRPLTLSCMNRICREKLYQKLERMILEKEAKIHELNEDINVKRPRYYNSIVEGDLFKYWDEIEANGNVHNVANGMLKTYNYLK